VEFFFITGLTRDTDDEDRRLHGLLPPPRLVELLPLFMFMFYVFLNMWNFPIHELPYLHLISSKFDCLC
jgi:hypothetical protein